MREIKYTSQFKRDYKREKRAIDGSNLDSLLSKVIDMLITDIILPENLHDHPLTGNWRGFRDSHVKPNLVLIYRKTKLNTLELVRLGSHSELGF